MAFIEGSGHSMTQVGVAPPWDNIFRKSTDIYALGGGVHADFTKVRPFARICQPSRGRFVGIKWRTFSVGLIMLGAGLLIVVMSPKIGRGIACQDPDHPLYQLYNIMCFSDRRPWVAILTVFCFGLIVVGTGLLIAISGFLGSGQ